MLPPCSTFKLLGLKSSLVKCMPVSLYSTTEKGKRTLFKYQNNLPSLPVPSLDQTLTLYKRAIIPFYPLGREDTFYQNYCKVIDNFKEVEGPELQKRLSHFAEGKRNWLSTIWDNYAYLGYREPVSPFVSYFFSHKNLNTEIGKDQLMKSAALSHRVINFMSKIEHETLEPELIKGSPLCMESFKWMFNNCRVPGLPSDTTIKFSPQKNRFMIVISNGYFYKVYHHDLNTGERFSLGQLYASISAVHNNSHQKPRCSNPIGILTASNRDVWATNYKHLCDNPLNKISLEQIQSASFVLCLDDNFPTTIAEKSVDCWYGNGYNRWFDKPVQLFVAKNASSSFLGEHSRMDGTPTLRMNDWIIKQISKMSVTEFHDEKKTAPQYTELVFEVDPFIQSQIQKEKKAFKQVTESLSINVWQFHGFGKEEIKAYGMSPDAFVQMLIQLAYYKYTGTVRPTYESASTRMYFKGRTETCRSVSEESLQFVRDWENTSKSGAEKIASLRSAINSHVRYVKVASKGLGVDRHLLGLTKMLRDGEKIPDIFKNPMYTYSQHWFLSTSQLSSNEFNGYGWSPVVPEGFGLAYMINPHWLHVNITAFKNNPLGLNPDYMAFYLTESIQELKEILSKSVIRAKI